MVTHLVLASGLPNPKNAPQQSWFTPLLIGYILGLLTFMLFHFKPWGR